jgi:predicted transcriptional regulator
MPSRRKTYECLNIVLKHMRDRGIDNIHNISIQTGLTWRTTRDALDELVILGLIKSEGQANNRRFYSIIDDSTRASGD